MRKYFMNLQIYAFLFNFELRAIISHFIEKLQSRWFS